MTVRLAPVDAASWRAYAPSNTGAARLYASLGFVEDGEAYDETVARLAL